MWKGASSYKLRKECSGDDQKYKVFYQETGHCLRFYIEKIA